MSEPLSKPIQQQCRRTPKKFLKKGEGLKRFAAYRPPLPVVTKKARETVVKFNLEKNKYSNPTYLPEILFDESIELSKEIPRIGPPKIMHTPIKPPPANNKRKTNKLPRYNLRSRRPVEAIVKRHISPTTSPQTNESPTTKSLKETVTSPDVIGTAAEDQINGKIDNLMKKIKEKKNSLDQENVTTINNNDSFVESNDHENEGCRTPLLMKPNQKVKMNAAHDLSTPSPGNFILALGKHIQQIEITVNELKEKMKNCQCGVEPIIKKASGRPTRKAQAIRLDDKNLRPSASADNTTPNMINCLADEIAKIKERMDELQLNR